MSSSSKSTAGVSVSILIATLGVPLVLLVMQQNVDARYGGALLLTLAEGALVLVAATLLILPIAWLARGSASRPATLTVYLIGLVGAGVVAFVSLNSGGLFTIFLTVPAITIAAIFVAAIAVRPLEETKPERS